MQFLRALYKRLEEKIFRTQKELACRRTPGLDPEIPLPSTPGRKGVRDPQEHMHIYYMNTCQDLLTNVLYYYSPHITLNCYFVLYHSHNSYYIFLNSTSSVDQLELMS